MPEGGEGQVSYRSLYGMKQIEIPAQRLRSCRRVHVYSEEFMYIPKSSQNYCFFALLH
jgi:hypothetical protein